MDRFFISSLLSAGSTSPLEWWTLEARPLSRPIRTRALHTHSCWKDWVKACSWILQASSHFSKCSALYIPLRILASVSLKVTWPPSDWLVQGCEGQVLFPKSKMTLQGPSAPELLWDRLQPLGQLHCRSPPPAQPCFIYPLNIIFQKPHPDKFLAWKSLPQNLFLGTQTYDDWD